MGVGSGSVVGGNPQATGLAAQSSDGQPAGEVEQDWYMSASK